MKIRSHGFGRALRMAALMVPLALCALAPRALPARAAPPPALDFAPVAEMLFEADGSPVRAIAYTDLFQTPGGYLFLDRRALSFARFDDRGRRAGGGPLRGADLPANCSAFALDEAGGRLLALDRDRDRILSFALDGRLDRSVPVRGASRAKRRIAQIDAKSYEFGKIRVHLDFLTRTVAWDDGGERESVRYEGLHPACEVFSADGRIYFRDPRVRSIARLPGFSPRFTGETLLAGGGGALFVVDRVRNEASRVSAEGEVLAVHAPADRRGPFVEDVAVFPDGGYALLDGRDARVFLYAADGVRVAVFGAKGDAPGRMEAPTDIVALPGERLLVRDAARGRGLLFDRSGKFLAEMQDLVEGESPAEFRALLDRDGRVHLVHLRERRLHVLRASHAWLREFSRILGSAARYPKEYFTLSPDGSILYFDAAKTAAEALRPDASIAALPVAEGLARFLEPAARRYGALAFDGRTIHAVTAEGRIDAIDPATGKSVARPSAVPAVALEADAFGALYALLSDGRLARLSADAKRDWRIDLRGTDYLLRQAGSGELFVAKRGGRRVSLLSVAGARIASLDLAAGGVVGLSARADRLDVFFERDGLLGVARFRRREVYKEAERHYTNGLYRMAAVRYEELVGRGHDGPAVRYRLYDCYRRLDRPDLAERERLFLLNSWPGSAEAARARRSE